MIKRYNKETKFEGKITLKKVKVVLTGGGTAGHITPALAIGKALREEYKVELHYFGNKNFIEKELALKEELPFYHIDSQGMEGKNPFDKWKNFITKNSKGIVSAYAHLKELQPDFIVSTGGFVTAPVLAAANALKIPYYIHEQNTVLGRVNKLFLMSAEEVFYSFEETIGGTGKRSGRVVGNPVSVNESYPLGKDLVVLGGSGGSEFLNQWSLAFAKQHPEITIHLQAGKNNAETLEKECSKENISNVQIYGYVDIKELYKLARLIVTRGGTSSLFEIANAELPAVVVPLPNSMDNHQYLNGMHFESTGGMIVVEQKEQESERKLDETVHSLWEDRTLLLKQRNKLKKLPYKNCVANIIKEIEDKSKLD